MKRLLLYICLAAFVASCNKNDNSDLATTPENDGVIRFTSDISTRAEKVSWVADDEIGIYIDYSDASYSDVENVKFSTTGSGVFTSETALYYPESGSIDVVSYYPYLEKDDLAAYPIDSSDQVDLLKAEATSKGTTVALNFKHLLSKVSVIIWYNDGFEIAEPDLIEGVSISGVCATATFNLGAGTVNDDLSGDGVTLSLDEGSTAKYSAIVIPQTLTEFILTVETTAGTFSQTLPRDNFVVGKSCEYTTIKLPDSVVKESSTPQEINLETRASSQSTNVPWSNNTIHEAAIVLSEK